METLLPLVSRRGWLSGGPFVVLRSAFLGLYGFHYVHIETRFERCFGPTLAANA